MPERDFRDQLAIPSLPVYLKGQGLHTTYMGGFYERHSAWWFYAGFREIHDSDMTGIETADELTPSVLGWIERNAQKNDHSALARRAGQCQR